MSATPKTPAATPALTDQLTEAEVQRRNAARKQWAKAVKVAAEAELAGHPLTPAELEQVAKAVADARRPRQEFLDDVKYLRKHLAAEAAWAALPSSADHWQAVKEATAKVEDARRALEQAQLAFTAAQNERFALENGRSAAQTRRESAAYQAREVLELLAE